MNFGPSGFLHSEELDAIIKVTLIYEKAFSFTREQKGLLSLDYADPYVIKTVPHEAWAARNIPLPKAKMEEIRQIYQQEIACGDLEPSDSPYNNPHFFVSKSNGKLRKVVDTTTLNRVVIRDLNVPPHLGEFVESLAGRMCYGSADGHSYFDQIRLHPDSRPMTAIHLPGYGHFQSTRMPQGMTNAPAYAQRVSTHIFFPMIPEHVQVYVDDTVMKGPRDDQDGRTLPGTNLRLWFLEYLRTYAQVLRRYEHAGLTFSGEKFIAITPRLEITGMVVDRYGLHCDPEKVARIQDWPCPPPDVSSLRGFLGLANYLRPFIDRFAHIDAPLRKLLSGRWRWNQEATAAMEQLQKAAARNSVLVPINYKSNEPLILAVDSSQIAAGWALYQGDEEAGQERKLNQFGSVGFSEVESRYSQPKLELCGVYKAVRALRLCLYGTFFILEVDASSIRQMINSPDVPNAAMTRWIAYLKLFDMEVRHVPAKRHTLPDGLSRTDFGTIRAAEEWPAEKVGLGPKGTRTWPEQGIGRVETEGDSEAGREDGKLVEANAASWRPWEERDHSEGNARAHGRASANGAHGQHGEHRHMHTRDSPEGRDMGRDLQGQGAASQEEDSGRDNGDPQGQAAETGSDGTDDQHRRVLAGNPIRENAVGGDLRGQAAAAQEVDAGLPSDDLQRQAVASTPAFDPDGHRGWHRRVFNRIGRQQHTKDGDPQGQAAVSQERGSGLPGGDLQGQAVASSSAITADGRQGPRWHAPGRDQPRGQVMGGDLRGQAAASQEQGLGFSVGDLQGQAAGTESAAKGDGCRRSVDEVETAEQGGNGRPHARAIAPQERERDRMGSAEATLGSGSSDGGTPDDLSFIMSAAEDAPFNLTGYSGKWRDLGNYLASGCSFSSIRDLPAPRRRWVKKQVGKFFVRGERLFRRQKDGIPQLVVTTTELQRRLLHDAHERCGHRGRDAMVGLLTKRVWWERLPLDCLEHARSCDPCQRRQHQHQREPMRHAPVPGLFQRFNLDIVDLGPGVGPRRYLVVARDAFTGWPEARLLADKASASVRDFLETEVLTRYGSSIDTILTDNGTENAGETAFLIQQLGFAHAHSTPYNPEGNTEVERGHGPLVEGLLKASFDDRLNTRSYLPYILWADRITTRRTTGYSPYELVFGQQPVLPMDVELQTFVLFDWSLITTTTDLVAARARQLKRRVDDLHLARLRLEHSRLQGRLYADERNAHRLRDPLPVGTLVLFSNPTHQARGQDRWFGPYRIARQLQGGSYTLVELDGTPLPRTYAAKDLRRYFPRTAPRSDAQAQHDAPPAAPAMPAVPAPGLTASPALPAHPIAPASAPLRLPRARMRRPAVPVRDLPPSGRVQPAFDPAALEGGLGLPVGTSRVATDTIPPHLADRIPPHLLLPPHRRLYLRTPAGPAPTAR